MRRRGVDVMEGNHIVEVKPTAINKGKIALEYKKRFNPDFSMAIGDDRTDEYMFEMLPESSYTIKVGPGNSFARFSIKDDVAVRVILKELAEADS